MTIAEIKNIMGLRRYWEYLKIRRYYINLGIIDVSDVELKNLIITRKIYLTAFSSNAGFRKWLLEKQHECRGAEGGTDKDRKFYKVAEQLKNKILEWEENGIYKN